MAVRADTPAYPVPWYRGRVSSWVTTVDHKRIGILYLVTCLIFFGSAGSSRCSCARNSPCERGFPDARLLQRGDDLHGMTMVFLVIVPILAGFGNYLVPLMIGARDVAFPRLNALSYWLFLFGGLVILF